MLTDVVIGVLAMSSRSVVSVSSVMSVRSVIGRRDTNLRVIFFRLVVVGAGVHTIFNIDPGESRNMSFLLAIELTQASPQSFWLNDFAPWNM